MLPHSMTRMSCSGPGREASGVRSPAPEVRSWALEVGELVLLIVHSTIYNPYPVTCLHTVTHFRSFPSAFHDPQSALIASHSRFDLDRPSVDAPSQTHHMLEVPLCEKVSDMQAAHTMMTIHDSLFVRIKFM